MKKPLKICLTATLSLVAVCAAASCILLYIIFTPARLTDMTNRILDRYLTLAHASVERAELTYFSTFPFFSLKLKDMLLLSKESSQDTLAYIPMGAARLNLSELVINKNIMVDQLEFKGGTSRIIIDSTGRLNWDVFSGSTKKKSSSTTPLDSLFNMADIKKIHLSSGKIVYENAVSKQNGTIENAEIKLKGSFVRHRLVTDLDFHLQSINYRDSAVNAYLSNLKLNTAADISNVFGASSRNPQSKKIEIKKIHLNSDKIVYENAVSKQSGTLSNADIRLIGSFEQSRFFTDLNLSLQNIAYRDTVVNADVSDLKLKLNAETKLLDTLKASSPYSNFANIAVKKIDIHSGKIAYENAVSKQNGAAKSAEIQIDGNGAPYGLLANINAHLQDALYRDSLVKTDVSDLKIRLNAEVQDSNILLNGAVFTDKLKLDYDKENFLSDAKLRISLNTVYNSVSRAIDVKEAVLGLNEMNFHLNGNALILPSGFKPNIRFALDETSLKSLYEVVPSKYVSGIDSSLKIFSGSIALSGAVRGVHSKKSKLQAQAALDIKKLRCKFREFSIDSLNIAAECKIPIDNLSAANVRLKNFGYWGNLGDVSMFGSIDGLDSNPHIETQIAANLNLSDLKYAMKDNKNFLTEGKVNLDLKGEFKLQDLLDFKPENLNINGVANIDTVVISNPQDSLNVYIDFARLRLGAQVDDTTLSEGKALLKGSVRLDSLDLNYKNRYIAKVGRLSAGYKCEEEKSSTVNAQSARLSVRGFNLQMPQEKIRIRTTRTSSRVEIKANPNKPTSPLLTLRVSSDTLAYRDRASRTGLRLGSADLTFNLMPVIPRNRSAQSTDSASGAVARRDSTRTPRPPNLKEMSSSDLIKLLLSMATEKDTAADLSQKFVRSFNYDGNLQFSDSRLRAPTFALPLQIASTAVTMTTRELFLKNAQIYMGNSDLLVTGALENFRRALLGRGVLRANAQIKSNKIDLNELMIAMAKKEAESASEETDNNFFDVKLDTATQESKVFVIPENLDFKLSVDIDTLLMGRSTLSDLRGDLDLKQQYLHLNNFNLFNRAGQINLKLLYRAQTPKEANLWATLNLNRAAIRDLIDIYPEIDSLLPMTKSLEGLIDCNVQITTKLDSAMSILLPNTVADFRAVGKNLVLLDGETFSKIAKTLMFKNKSRNMMDSVSLSLVVKDNAIEIFPMVIAIDRYKFAVGGVQNLDMTFNYHVTVLESPLSFKLGIDINGNVDKFNYKIAKPKYKSVEKPAISREFSDRTVSVQREVNRLIEYEFEHIMENMLQDGN